MRRKRRLRRFAVGAAILIVLPLVLLHGAALLFWKHGRSMLDYESLTVTNSFGGDVRGFELEQTNAVWNILFIHGTPGSAADFHAQFEHPYPGANLIAVNRPGFGGSKPALRKPSLEAQAQAIGALLLTLTNHPTILVGHSYGGPVALWTALEFSNRVAGVVLIGGAVDPGQEHPYWIQRVGNWGMVSWVLPRPMRQANRELLTLKGDLLELQTQLPSLTVPVVMLHGMKDPLVPEANVDYLRGQLATMGKTNLFESLVFSNYNHFIPWKHPEAVKEALDMITARVASEPPR